MSLYEPYLIDKKKGFPKEPQTLPLWRITFEPMPLRLILQGLTQYAL